MTSGMTSVKAVTRESLKSRREKILKAVDLTFEELSKRARGYSLTPDEWAAWEEICEIDFLLGDDK